MPLLYKRRIAVKDCQNHPDWKFVFGDNLMQRGKAGQAVIRDEPNSIGIPTKRAPGMLENDFFTPNDFPHWLQEFSVTSDYLQNFVSSDGVLIWPADNIGTGLAQLPQRAPNIFASIGVLLSTLERL